MNEIGSFIKSKRDSKVLSLKRLSELSGISDSEINKIENGSRKDPNWRILCAIAKALEIHPFEILFAAGYISKDDITPAHKIKRLEKLSDKDLETVQLFVDFIIERNKSENGKEVETSNDI